MQKRCLLILSFFLLAACLRAQTPLHSYFCDFENPAENSCWRLNTPRNMALTWPNLWTIGSATAASGNNALYISPDGGATAAYTQQEANVMIAWRTLTMEKGQYDLAFDWKAMGNTAAWLMVCWIPAADSLSFVCGHNSIITGRRFIENNLIAVHEVDTLNNSLVWQQATASITSDGTPRCLMFVWVNGTFGTLRNPGGCIDNVQLARNNCGRPADLQALTEGQRVTLSWQSSGESFNLRYRKHGSSAENILRNIRYNQQILNLQHGVYDFHIQVVCEGDTSVWYQFPPVIIYDSKCFNYLQLTDSNCYYSQETSTDYRLNVFERKKYDYGYQNRYSRHTLHYMEGEVDARTYDSNTEPDGSGTPVPPLKTVPDGEIASVRIGGWETTAHVSRVMYDFTVDLDEAAALMMRYAAVLELPDHDEAQQPRFTLALLDADTGDTLSRCTTVDFAATARNARAKGWYFAPNDKRPVVWKDWTTVGLNLRDFDGTHVQIVLTVYGCTAEIHFGYAYFTLSCTKGEIEGINCGDTPTNEFVAPEGFNYHWYDVGNPSAVLPNAAERVFPVQYDDTTTYKVDCIYKTDPGCRFTLTASAVPRYPVPEPAWKLAVAGCSSTLTLSHTSHIRKKNIRENRYYDTAEPTPVIWDFGGLYPQTAADTLTLSLPAEGGVLRVLHTAMVGLCDSVVELLIPYPAIGDTTVCDTAYECSGNAYSFEGRTYTRDTLITTTGLTWAGCDSTHQQHVVFRPSYHLTLDSTIYEGGVVHIGPESFTQTGRYTVRMQTAAGCDSVMNLSLVMVPRLRTELVDTEYPCLDQPDFTASFRMLTGRATDGAFVWSRLQEGGPVSLPADTFRTKLEPGGVLRVPLPAGLQPGWYDVTAVLSSPENGPDTLRFELMVRYPASLIQQRWNNVLGLSRAGYGVNPDWEFVSWQWYKNGQPVEEATGGYYYEEPSLDTQSRYAVELTRPGCERSVMTCDLTPRPVSESDVRISPDASGDTRPSSGPARKLLQDGRLLIELFGRRYTLLGQPL
ncbi:MAG: hypothetical protein IJ169_02290 [Paludibacteraceae bacterium]|nr:hypothetical protein [Paludibacteraceae bacterium]